MLHLHRAERADALVDALGDVLRSPLADPLQAEVVAVPTRGVERWLTQRLAHRLGASGGRSDGVCANLAFPFPGSLVGDATAAACGVDLEHDPWRPERAVWPLIGLLDDAGAEAWLAPVGPHLEAGATTPAGDAGRSRRFTTARHLSDLFDRYGVHRPQMIRSWAQGDDVTATSASLPAASRWQAELWRRLRARIGSEAPAERLARACAALEADPTVADLPSRLSIFGLTRLPASYVDVLRALAAHRDVHLYLLHPSPALWRRIEPIAAGRGAVTRRADDPSTEAAHNPLLRSWGRDAREMQLVVAAAGREVEDDHRAMDAREPVTLLERTQHGVRADVAPPGAPPAAGDERPVLGAGDRTVQVHACHGRARQVEVLRDAILHLLADDPTLEARDVIVMCPDIEAFAPLIHATFGAGDGFDDDEEPPADAARPADLRVRLADRSLRQTNPMLSAVSDLLGLADGRVTSTQVLDFAGRDPVRRRFRLDDDDLARLKEWVAETGVRWGLDAPQRARFKLQNVEQNTWRFGLDRVLVGVTMADEEQRLVDDVLPLDDVDSAAIDLAGRFAELVDRLHAAVDALQGPMPVAGWSAAIAESAQALLATTDADAWQRAQLHRILDELVGEATIDGVPSDAALELPEARTLLADRLRGRPTRANFRTGHLTVCTLVPMRSVPHRVVCLLGLDDDAFPRRTERDGDDLVAADPFVGDGDSRSEDRQLLLDALLAATDCLVITYSGHDERTNAPLAPAVPVGELLDIIDATVRWPAGTSARDRIVVQHPLQPFDPRNFERGRLGTPDAWSFDAVTLEGAEALIGDRPARTAFLGAPLSPRRDDGGVIELDQLVKFVQHPVKAFLRQRLGVSVGDYSEDVLEVIPVELDALEQWTVGDRLLESRLLGASAEACAAAEFARGALPPHGMAGTTYDAIAKTVERLVEEAALVTGGRADADSLEVTVRLDDGRLLVGTVPGVVGRVARAASYSKVAAKHRLTAWVRFLAMSAGRPTEGFEVVTLGRSSKKGPTITIARISPLAADPSEAEALARRHLHDLVDLYDRGMREPLPIYCKTSAAYAAAQRDPKADWHKDATFVWESNRFPNEDKDPEHVLVLGGVRTLDDLLVTPPCEDEVGAGWDETDDSRFGRYARRLWNALLDVEQIEHKK